MPSSQWLNPGARIGKWTTQSDHHVDSYMSYCDSHGSPKYRGYLRRFHRRCDLQVLRYAPKTQLAYVRGLHSAGTFGSWSLDSIRGFVPNLSKNDSQHHVQKWWVHPYHTTKSWMRWARTATPFNLPSLGLGSLRRTASQTSGRCSCCRFWFVLTPSTRLEVHRQLSRCQSPGVCILVDDLPHVLRRWLNSARTGGCTALSNRTIPRIPRYSRCTAEAGRRGGGELDG